MDPPLDVHDVLGAATIPTYLGHSVLSALIGMPNDFDRQSHGRLGTERSAE